MDNKTLQLAKHFSVFGERCNLTILNTLRHTHTHTHTYTHTHTERGREERKLLRTDNDLLIGRFQASVIVGQGEC